MKERILVVEDDDAIVRVLQRALSYEGYQVDAAGDGETGLKIALEHRPDLVILDLMLRHGWSGSLPPLAGSWKYARADAHCERYRPRPHSRPGRWRR
ncbi:MAG TPA: response regulator [Anaerolineaceae bacterium]|nr:response regulator [Anaerolineaceae bacterium]